jgi:hypothetical protein
MERGGMGPSSYPKIVADHAASIYNQISDEFATQTFDSFSKSRVGPEEMEGFSKN